MTEEIDYGFTWTERNHTVVRNIFSQTILARPFILLQHFVYIAGVQFVIFAISRERNRVIIINAIIRRLLGILDLSAIGQRGRPESIVASLIGLGVVTILVFGIPVGGVVYISRLT